MCKYLSDFGKLIDDFRLCGVFSDTNELLSFDKEFEVTGQCLKMFSEKIIGFKVLPYAIIANNAANLK